MIINFSNIGTGGGSGSGYTLPIASDTTLGGIKVGSGLSIDGSTGVLSTAGINDTVYEYDAITAMTADERKELFKELTASTLNGEKVWVHRQYNADDYWFLIDTVNSTLLKFSSKNDDSITNFTLGVTGNYSQAKKYYCPKASASQLGGIKVGSGLSIDNSGVLSVSGGSQSGPTVIDFDAMTQAELETLYGELSGATSANTINKDYIFIKAFYDYDYSADLGPIRIQYIGPSGDRICFGSANYNKSRNQLFVFGVWLTSDGSIDYGFDTYEKGISGISKYPIFRDYWHLYYDTTTSGFSFDTDGSLTPITYGTGNTCSGMWQFDADSMPSFLGTPGLDTKIGWFGVKINTAEGVRKYAYPSFSYVQLNSAVTFTDSDGNTQSLDKKAYFDYGEFVVSLYYNGEWRFGGLEINFR